MSPSAIASPPRRTRRLLDAHSVVPYLVEAGLLQRDGADAAVVVDLTSRNRCFAVTSGPRGRGYFVKQAAFAADVPAVVHEAEMLERTDITSPRLLARDDDAGVFVCELVRHAETLREHHVRTGSVAAETAAALGRALAELHALSPAAPVREPAVLSAHRPRPDVFRHLTPVERELLEILQGMPGLCAGLDALRREWHPTCLVHGDVRWDNVVVELHAPSRVHLVDWEHAGAGDARVDVGAAFAEHLWAERSAARAFWLGYAERRGLAPDAARRLLLDALRFAAARFVGAALEVAAEAAEGEAAFVAPLRLAAGLLDEPERAARGLGLVP